MAIINIGTLFGTIELEDKLSPALLSAGKNLDSMGDKFDKAGTRMSNAGRAFLPLTAGIAAIGAGALTAAVEFESSFAGVKKTVDGITDEFGNLNAKGLEVQKGIIELSQTIPATTTELNAIAESAGQLGIKADAIVGFTRTIAGMGEATNFSSEAAATMMAQFANITKLEQTNENFERLGSTIVALGNAGASTEQDIGNFALRIAGAGEVGAFTEAHILAIGSAFASAGINAEAGGTAIQKVMFEMTKATALGGEKLDLFAKTAGVSADTFKKAFEKDPGTAFNMFVQGLGREGIAATTTLDELGLRGSNLARSFISVAGAGNLLTEQLELGTKAWEENSALTDETSRRYATTESQLKILWNEVRNLGMELGVSLLPILHDVMESFRDFVPYIKGAVDWFKELTPEGQKNAVMLAAIVAAGGPVLMFLGSLASGIGAVFSMIGPLITGLGTVTTFLAGLTPVGWAVAAAIGAVALAWANWDTITDIVSKVYNGVKEWIGDKLSAIFEGVRQKIEAVKGWFAGMYDAVVGHSYVPDMIKGIEQEMAKLGPGMEEPSKKATKAVKQDFKELNEVLAQFSGREVIERGLQMAAAVEHIGGMTKLTTAEQRTANQAIQEALEKYRALGVEAPAALQNLNTVLQDTAQMTANVFYAMQAITPAINDVNASTLALGSSIINMRMAMEGIDWNPLIQGASDAVRSTGQIIHDNLADIFRGLPDTIIKSIMGGGNPGGALGAQLVNAFLPESALKNITQHLSSKLGSTIGSALGSVIPGLGTMLGGMAGQFIGPLLGKIGGMFKSLFGGPSAEELAGRELVAAFEANIARMLTEAQKMEAGNESWKMTVIGIRDAYIAAGYTAEQGEKAAAKLWESSKKGGEESKRVIEEITRIMEMGTKPAVQAIETAFVSTGDVAVEKMRKLRYEIQTLETEAIGSGNQGLIAAVENLKIKMDEAAANGLTDFANMAVGIDAIKKQIAQPITIEVVMQQVEQLGDTLTSRSGSHSVSSGWQLKPGQTMEEALQEFLIRNPGDAHRFPGAIADVHRIDEAMTNVPGFQTGTPGLAAVDFGRGTLVETHGREHIVPESRREEFIQKYSAPDHRSVSLLAAIEMLLRDMPVQTAIQLRDHVQLNQRSR